MSNNLTIEITGLSMNVGTNDGGLASKAHQMFVGNKDYVDSGLFIGDTTYPNSGDQETVVAMDIDNLLNNKDKSITDFQKFLREVVRRLDSEKDDDTSLENESCEATDSDDENPTVSRECKPGKCTTRGCEHKCSFECNRHGCD